MNNVLIFIGHYLPGWRVGGPARSTASMAESLTDYKFHIFASETDFASDEVLEGIGVDQWQQWGRAKVFYASAKRRTSLALRRKIREIKPDLIYLHGFFARRFTMPILVLRRLSLLPRIPIIVAPRGEFSPGALKLKQGRKAAYLRIARCLGLYGGVIWHAASEQEQNDIRRVQGDDVKVVLASNFPAIPHTDAAEVHEEKDSNRCKLVFLSRISREKNLFGAIETLTTVHGNVVFDIYGPIENADYWARCQSAMDRLPKNVTIRYCGEITQGASQGVFAGYDALFLPTLGENYGYVIVEAWAAATPVLISNRTPWDGLEDDHAGWSAAPDDHAAFAESINALAAMDETEHRLWRDGALRRAWTLANDAALRAAYDHLFEAALENREN
ncbi:MAG: glycosyltransferase family 4 protein [Gammaproteobacteria bacterium]